MPPTATRPDVLVLSRIVLDEFTTPDGRTEQVLGGSGFWAAVGAAMATEEVCIATKVGRGFEAHLDQLRSLGIRDDAVLPIDAPPSVTRISYPQAERRHEEPLPSWQAHLSMRSMLDDVPEPVREARSFYVFRDLHPGFFPPVLEASERSGAPVLWEIPGVVCAGGMTTELAGVLRRIHVLSINRAEAADLIGPRDPGATVDALLDLGPDVVTLRLGARGSIVADRDHRLSVGAAAANVVDVTGAGNAYSGAFLARYAGTGGDLEAAAVAASAAAGTVTERVGPPRDRTAGRTRCEELATTVTIEHHRPGEVHV